MGTQKSDKDKPFTGEIWFMTDINSPKVAEINANPKVLLSYAESKKQDYISVAGTATIVRDQAKVKEFWTEAFKAWFPDGPEDPDIALIRVDAEAAEYWDAPSKAIVYAYGYFKAKLTGQQPDIGENRKVAL
ncbi:MAG: ral stress protein 26 [Micavibrio sp.]|nr:ral stress protein 26 [Micavibrio sp.]